MFRSAIEMFNCITVDTVGYDGPTPSPFRGSWLLMDMSQKCYEGMHLRYVVTATLASLVVCVVVRCSFICLSPGLLIFHVVP